MARLTKKEVEESLKKCGHKDKLYNGPDGTYTYENFIRKFALKEKGIEPETKK